MDETKYLGIVAEQYRSEGYEVVVRPGRDQLPESLAGFALDLIARRGKETVAVEVKRRDQLYDVGEHSELVRALPDWNYDLVVLPNGDGDSSGTDAAEAPAGA